MRDNRRPVYIDTWVRFQVTSIKGYLGPDDSAHLFSRDKSSQIKQVGFFKKNPIERSASTTSADDDADVSQ